MSRALSQSGSLRTAPFVGKSTPAAAGARANRFNAELSLYNATPANMRGFRNALAKARAGSLVTLTFLGDSKIAGLGTNGMVSINAAASAPGCFRTALAGRGYPIAGTGPVFPFCNPAVGTADTRWTFTGTWSAIQGTPNVNFRSSTVSGSTATFTSDLAGTVVEIRSLSNSAAFTYSIDGAAAVTVTPSGTNVLHTTTVTGLASTTHTVVITTTTNTATYVECVNVRQTSGIQIANHGISGSNTTHWIGPLWYHAKAVAETLPSDGVFLSLGTNDSGTGVTIADFKTNMTTIVSAQKALGRPVMLILPTAPATTHVAYASWPNYVAAHYDLAESLDVPLLDLNDIYGTQAQAMTNGMMFDEVHEKEAGYALNAASILGALYR
jgi:lysophospholipase L1-like esterase